MVLIFLAGDSCVFIQEASILLQGITLIFHLLFFILEVFMFMKEKALNETWFMHI